MNETDKNSEETTENACLNCGAHSDDKPLLPIEINKGSKWVCVRCLPILIHG